MDENGGDSLYAWTARSVRPVVVLYVLLVFLAFMALAEFVFHSADAVKALLFAAVGSTVAMVPGLQGKIEYQLSSSGLSKRPVRTKKPAEFEVLFSWNELSEVVPTKRGFKFYKAMESRGLLKRFAKQHLLSGYSGEVHVEPGDLDQVRRFMEGHGAPIPREKQVEPRSHPDP
jgi:hypothetical protein